MTTDCHCHDRREPGFRHHEVVILSTFAQAVLDLHSALHPDNRSPMWSDRAYDAARAAVRCARMLELKEEYR